MLFVAVAAPRGPDLAAAVLGSWLAGATVTNVVSDAKLVLGATETAPDASIPWRPISYAVTVTVDPDAGAVPADGSALPGVTHQELADSVGHVARLVGLRGRCCGFRPPTRRQPSPSCCWP